MSTFIDLYHKYTPKQAATQERPHLTAYTSGDTKQDDCVCVLESEYPCPLHPPWFISDPLSQSSPWSLFTWFHLPGIPLNLTSTYPSPSHLSRFGSKAASSKKLFSALHHHHHSLAFILYHLLSLVSLSLETPMIFALNPYFPGTGSPVVCPAQDWIHSFRYKKLLDGTCMPMSVYACTCVVMCILIV